MADITQPAAVKLVAAITYTADRIRTEVIENLEAFLGPVDNQSRDYQFVHTDYYELEMGTNLRKVFLSFETLVPPDFLPECKIRTNGLEKEYLSGHRRTVNVDPGYVADAKLVMATAKNFSHRIYIGKGIYGDLQFIFQNNGFRPMPWCFPDYRQEFIVDFFKEVRLTYFNQVRESNRASSKPGNPK